MLRVLLQGRCCCCSALGCGHQNLNVNDELLEGSARESPRRKRRTLSEYIIDFFGGWFFRNIVTHKYVRWFVLLTSAVIIGVAIGFAIQLEPDKEQVSDILDFYCPFHLWCFFIGHGLYNTVESILFL